MFKRNKEERIVRAMHYLLLGASSLAIASSIHLGDWIDVFVWVCLFLASCVRERYIDVLHKVIEIQFEALQAQKNFFSTVVAERLKDMPSTSNKIQ